MRGSTVPEDVWNTISSYQSTSEIAAVSTAGIIGGGGIGSENVLMPENMVLDTSMVYDYGNSCSYTITPRPLNYHMAQQSSTSDQHYNHITSLPPNQCLRSAYPINTSTSSNYSGHPSDPTYPNTTPSDIYNDNDTSFFTNAGSSYSTPSTNTNHDDSASFPHLNAIGPSGTSQNLYPDGFIPHAVTTPVSRTPSLACPNAPIPTLPYAYNDLRLRSRSLKPYACNLGRCHDKGFRTSQLRLTHARRWHKSFLCSYPDCPRMEDYTDFKSRQSLDDHWELEHQATKHFRCGKCCYSTGNATHMREHIKKHYPEGGGSQAMEVIKQEKNDRNRKDNSISRKSVMVGR